MQHLNWQSENMQQLSFLPHLSQTMILQGSRTICNWYQNKADVLTHLVKPILYGYDIWFSHNLDFCNCCVFFFWNTLYIVMHCFIVYRYLPHYGVYAVHYSSLDDPFPSAHRNTSSVHLEDRVVTSKTNWRTSDGLSLLQQSRSQALKNPLAHAKTLQKFPIRTW